MPTPILLWFRRSFRMHDNEVLAAAAQTGRPIVPVFIDGADFEPWPTGAAQRWWLHHSLKFFSQDLQERGVTLLIRKGDPLKVLRDLESETGAQSLYVDTVFEPFHLGQDQRLQAELPVEFLRFNTGGWIPPEKFLNKSQKPYQVFKNFWERLQTELPHRSFFSISDSLRTLEKMPPSLKLEELNLLPVFKTEDWTLGFQKHWEPGEAGAQKKWTTFLEMALTQYKTGRDLPGFSLTSQLSPHLHFGEISPYFLLKSLREAYSTYSSATDRESILCYLRELGWREFAQHLLFHFPNTPEKPLKPDFEKFPWEMEERILKDWKRGRTGYPIVDAGLRELWKKGWMHNRVRMIVASFLVKHLLIPWQEGARWFWDTLLDADLANNTLGWQWVAGCGADAAPYFRFFNPVLQGEKFDGDGNYVRRWVPEIAALPNRWIHKPWEAPEEVLKKARIELGKTYPTPIVNHAWARARALEGFKKMRK